ncbi:unnamed protein product [Merluccius merluccius]
MHAGSEKRGRGRAMLRQEAAEQMNRGPSSSSGGRRRRAPPLRDPAAMAEEAAGPVDISKAADMATDEGYDKKCIFCKIVRKEMSAELLHCDEEISCFRDIKPGAPHHYLVVPTRHVGNCKSLTKQHVPLVQRMVEVGKEILEKNNVTDLSDVRFGFHWPPFCSVSHLHLHVLAPASELGFMSRIFYRLNSYWFVTVDQLIQLLNSKSETD